MSPLIIVTAVALLGFFLWWLTRGLYRRVRRSNLLTAPLPDDAVGILQRRMPLYNKLSTKQQRTMQGCINRLLF